MADGSVILGGRQLSYHLILAPPVPPPSIGKVSIMQGI